MTIEQLRELHARRPFQPFEIQMADGRSLPVEHPEFLSQATTGRTVAVALRDGTHQIVDLLLVTSLEVLPNGARRRKRG